MEDEDNVREPVAHDDADPNSPAAEDWPLTLETDERPAEEAGYGYGV